MAGWLRLLHLPNDQGDAVEVGSRRTFEALVAEDRLQAYEAYPYQVRAETSPQGWAEELLGIARRLRPQLILWQHVGEFQVPPALLQSLREATGARLVYHSGDPFGRLFKRIGRPVATLLAAADLVLVVGSGSFVSLARRHGARRVRPVLQPFDKERFGQPWEPTAEREVDAVLIGHAGVTRVPGMLLPGGRRRRALVRGLCARLGPGRLAVHGHGWDVPCARGILAYTAQQETIRRAWVSVNWDHFDREPHYASDRLAISLAAGVAHVTTRHRGYDDLFGECEGLLLADTVPEAIELTCWALEQGPQQLLAWGAANRDFAHAHLEAGVVWRGVLDAAVRELYPGRALPGA